MIDMLPETTSSAVSATSPSPTPCGFRARPTSLSSADVLASA